MASPGRSFSPIGRSGNDPRRTQPACYLHACLRYVERDPMTNSTLRARLGISEPNKAMASRIISDAIKDGRVKPEDPHQGRKYAKYIPFWA